MITTVKTRKKIQKDQDPDRDLDRNRQREKSLVRKNEKRGEFQTVRFRSKFKNISAAQGHGRRQKSARDLDRRMIKSRLENDQNLMINLNRK